MSRFIERHLLGTPRARAHFNLLTGNCTAGVGSVDITPDRVTAILAHVDLCHRLTQRFLVKLSSTGISCPLHKVVERHHRVVVCRRGIPCREGLARLELLIDR